MTCEILARCEHRPVFTQIFNQFIEGDRLSVHRELPCIGLRQRQEIIHEPTHPHGLLQKCRCELSLRVRRHRAAERKFCLPTENRQRRSQLMRHIHREEAHLPERCFQSLHRPIHGADELSEFVVEPLVPVCARGGFRY